MSHSTQVALKDNWSITCRTAAQYEGMKTLLIKLGYTFEEHDRYDALYTTVCSSDITEGGATQGFGIHPEDNHFGNMIDFLVFFYGAESEFAVQIAEKRAQIDALETEILSLAA